jgi:Zn-dependent protease with chaperone function
MNSPIVVAISVFLLIYLAFFLIRLFADFILVGIAVFSAGFIYYFLSDAEIYKTIIVLSKEIHVFSLLFQGLPEHLEEVDQNAKIVLASLITLIAVLISIPFLPFSATYRFMFGVENPVFQRKESKVRGWIVEEIHRYHRQQEIRRSEKKSHSKNKK